MGIVSNGENGGPLEAGTYQLEENNFADCSLCVVRSFGNALALSPEFVTGHFEAFLSENPSWTQD